MARSPLDRGRRRLLVTALVVAGLLLAACGDTLQTAAEQVDDLPDFVEPEAADEPPTSGDAADSEPDPVPDGPARQDDPVEQEDPARQNADDADAADADGDAAEADAATPQPPAGDGPSTHADRCALSTSPQAERRPEAQYLDVIGEVNLGLEQVVVDLDAALGELEAGISDGPSLAAELESLLDRYGHLTAEVPQLAPLEGAEDWHADAVGRFEAVCLAMLDGVAGIEAGDEQRFAAFVDALREFPTLGNELHATMMVGPFEAG